MKILVLDGFPLSTSSGLGQAVREILSEARIDYIRLAEEDIAWCRGCFNCWFITPGECVIQDFGNTVANKFVNSNLTILLTPLTFGSYSHHLKKALDRMIPNLSGLFTQVKGETHHVKRYPRYPALLALAEQEIADSGAAELFHKLVERNNLNLYPASSASHVFTRGSDIRPKLMELLKLMGVTV